MNLLLFLVILLFLFGGGGYVGHMQPTYHYGGIGTILIVILILWLLGYL